MAIARPRLRKHPHQATYYVVSDMEKEPNYGLVWRVAIWSTIAAFVLCLALLFVTNAYSWPHITPNQRISNAHQHFEGGDALARMKADTDRLGVLAYVMSRALARMKADTDRLDVLSRKLAQAPVPKPDRRLICETGPDEAIEINNKIPGATYRRLRGREVVAAFDEAVRQAFPSNAWPSAKDTAFEAIINYAPQDKFWRMSRNPYNGQTKIFDVLIFYFNKDGCFMPKDSGFLDRQSLSMALDIMGQDS